MTNKNTPKNYLIYDYEVDVIVTTYNRINELERCIKSIIFQTYKRINILIISDGYDVRIVDLLKNIVTNKRHIKYLYSKNHTGRPSVLRNLGISNSKSQFVCFCDDDDYWIENKISAQIQYLKNNSYDFVSTNAYVHQKNELKFILNNNLFTNNLKISLLLRSKVILSSVMIQRKYLDKYSFEESDTYKGWEDFYLWLNLFYKEKINFKYINQPLIYYTLSGDSIRKKSNIRKFIRIYTKIFLILLKEKKIHLIIITSPVQLFRIITELFKIRSLISRV